MYNTWKKNFSKFEKKKRARWGRNFGDETANCLFPPLPRGGLTFKTSLPWKFYRSTSNTIDIYLGTEGEKKLSHLVFLHQQNKGKFSEKGSSSTILDLGYRKCLIGGLSGRRFDLYRYRIF